MKKLRGFTVLALWLLTTGTVVRAERIILDTAYPELRCGELARLIGARDPATLPETTRTAAEICSESTSLDELAREIDSINRGILELRVPPGLDDEGFLAAARKVMPEANTPLRSRALMSDFRADPEGMRRKLIDTGLQQQQEFSRANAADVDGVGGLAWQARIIEGITAFLVERSKAEAMFSLVSRLREEVCGKDDFVAEIFTNTCALLEATEGSVTLPTFGATWRAAFEQDLKSILPKLVSPEIPEEYRPVLDGAVEVLLEIYAGGDPLEALVELEARAPITRGGDWDCDPAKPALWVALIGRYVGVHYTSPEEGKPKSMQPPTRRTLHKTFKENCPVLAYRGQAVDKLAASLSRLEREIKSLKDRIGEKDLSRAERAALYIRYLDSVFSAYAFFSELVPEKVSCDAQPTTSSQPCRNRFRAWAEAARTAFEIQAAVTNSDYGQVVVKATVLLQKLDELTGAGFGFPSSFYRIANLAADVASAPTAAEVQQAIEAAALPVGGYRIKRGDKNRFRGFNAYVGVAVGKERLEENVMDATESLDSSHYGVWAPVGFEFSWGSGSSASNGVFLSAIDVGAILSYRFDSDSESVDDAPEVGFKQIVSPGLFYVRGQGPLTIGLGVQVSPALRRVTSAGLEVEEDALRFSLTLALDIPIIQF